MDLGDALRLGPERGKVGAAMIADWDDAYANSRHIVGGEQYPARWAAEAAAFREKMTARGRAGVDLAYGGAERQRLDLFRPEGEARGLLVFVHGGFWKAFDKSTWSHFATGPLARGWAVAMPSYTLAPEARIREITRQIGRAISFAAGLAPGGIVLAGHSAGGHLVTRMLCADGPLAPAVRERVQGVISISGLHDLRPLLATQMNDTLRLDAEEAAAESAALGRPTEGARVVCWVGADERPEFVRQNDLLANIWTGLGAETRAVHAPGRHHYNVLDDLADPQSELARICAP
jgi:arylformamidase